MRAPKPPKPPKPRGPIQRRRWCALSPGQRARIEAEALGAEARKEEARQARKSEARARYRTHHNRHAEARGLRIIRMIRARPSPAGLHRLAGLAADPEQDTLVRTEAARAILVMAHGEVSHHDDGNEG